MGLLKSVTTNSGINIDNAYFRIDSITGNQNTVSFSLTFYVSQNAFLEGKGHVGISWFSFTPDVSDDALNLFRQAYAYLKSIDNYKDADDVLEEGQTPL